MGLEGWAQVVGDLKPGSRVLADALGAVRSRAPGPHCALACSLPWLLHLGTAIHPVAKAPSQGVASVPLFLALLPLPPPYRPSKVLSSLFSKYIPNSATLHPSPAPRLLQRSIVSGPGEHNGFFTRPFPSPHGSGGERAFQL